MGRQHAANLLTLSRLAAVPPLFLLARAGHFEAAFGVFILAGATDLADGYVAKRFSGRTAFGAVIDPVADKLLMASVLVTLASIAAIPAWLVVLILARDLAIVTGVLALRATIGAFHVAPLLLGKLCTFAQVVLACVVLAELALIPGLAPLVPPLIGLTAALVLASGIAYIRVAWVLSAEASRGA